MLGSAVLVELEKKHEVLGIDRADLEIESLEEVLSTVELEKPELVIHCAAYTDVDGCETDPDKAYVVNALGTRNVALACQRQGAVLVYVSTDFVFDGKKPEPYHEFDRTSPISVYGRSKLMGEECVRSLLSRYIIARTAWLYGDHRRRTFIRMMFETAQRDGTVRAVTDQIGSPTYAKDLAPVLLELVESEAWGTYHTANDGSCSRFELAQEIVRLGGLDAEVRPAVSADFPVPAPRPANSALRGLALERTLGRRLRPWQDALAEYIEVLKSS